MLEKIAGSIATNLNSRGNETPDPLLADEARKARQPILHHLMSLAHEIQVLNFLKIKLYSLVDICENLYAFELAPHPNAGIVLEMIMATIHPLYSIIPPAFILPALFRRRKAEAFSNRWNMIANQLKAQQIDRQLVEIMMFPFISFQVSEAQLNRLLLFEILCRKFRAHGYCTCRHRPYNGYAPANGV
jgi:hypothetical protein